MHPSELHQLKQTYQGETGLPQPEGAVVPGSFEEAQALARIEDARADADEGLTHGHPDVPGLTFRRSASERAAAASIRYWRRHG